MLLKIQIWYFILFGCFLGACSRPSANDFGNTPALMPADEASPEERKTIVATVARIENYASEYGYHGSFRILPILVTSEDWRAKKRIGYCDRGRFIVLNRFVFHSNCKPLSLAFDVLLHEIGHCYFGRKHENTHIEKDGYSIQFKMMDSLTGTIAYLDGFPVSIMSVISETEGDLFGGWGIPSSLEKYFVRELLGGPRVRETNDVASLPGMTFVPKTVSTQHTCMIYFKDAAK